MTAEEVLKIKRFDKLGMTLMGFKPSSYLKVYHNTKHSTFVYPDEKTVTGSSQCMDALVHEMQRKEKIAIVRVQVRDNAQVRFCALLPSLPKDAEDETQMGFQLIVLPYADDIRELDRIMEASGYPKDRKEDEPTVID
jgi:ATP-dependent DNA helicase 2 subunit 1